MIFDLVWFGCVYGVVWVLRNYDAEAKVPKNCELAELEDGSVVLIASRDISAGEWFTIAAD